MRQDHDPVEWEGVSPEVVAEFAKTIGLLNAAPNRISYLLMVQLYLQAAVADIGSRVVAEIKALEGLGQSYGMRKDFEPFRKLPLRGLMKKHYLPRNSEAIRKNLENERWKQRERLSAFITDQAQKVDHSAITEGVWEAAGAVSSLVCHDFWNDRKARNELTGEWIVLAQHEGQNYYLTLAKHKEGATQKEGDQRIYCRIVESCIPQFPFLAHIIDTGASS